MPVAMPILGIDFGTSGSKMAWYNPQTHRAEIIKNAEGDEQTPSMVYIDKHGQVQVGRVAEKMLTLETECLRVVSSVKRQLATRQYVSLPEGRIDTLELAAALLRKLKRDAETLHFHQPVEHTVISVPATFSSTQKARVLRAAEQAGFRFIQLLEEPAAAALAYMYQSLDLRNHDIGKRIMVYDLGGGTFDLALVVREPEGTFRRVVRSRGEFQCGGDDLDECLYGYCDRWARQTLGCSLSQNGQRNLVFLQQCRSWKEELSLLEQHTLCHSFVNAQQLHLFRQNITRSEFEELITPIIQKTIYKTQELLREDQADGYTIDNLVLIGGSTRIPLVQRLLSQTLHMQPLEWEARDLAVALGAARHANLVWKPENQYRWAVEAVWRTKVLTASDVSRLEGQALELELEKEQAEEMERKVFGRTKEQVLALQQGREQYSQAVEREMGMSFTSEVVARLAYQERKLGLSQAEAATIERSLLGKTRAEALAHQEAIDRYAQEMQRIFAVGLERASLALLSELARTLGLSQDEAALIEQKIMHAPKEQVFAQIQARERYTLEVKTVWKEGWLNEQKVARLRRVASQLPLGPDDLASIEQTIMGGRTKEEILKQTYQ